MRRPLLAGAALFGAGCLATDGAGERGQVLALLLLAAALIALVPFARGRALALALGAATVALGAAAVRVESAGLARNPLRRLASAAGEADGDAVAPVRVVGVLRGDAFEAFGRLAMALDAEAVESGGRRLPVSGRVRLSVGGEQGRPVLLDGDRVAVWARLTPPLSEAPRDGTVAFGYCKSTRLVEPLGRASLGLLRRAADRVRRYAREAITRSIMPGPERGLVLAMVLGDRSEIDEATAEAFRASGTYHVLALSGAQVALVAGLIVGALRLLRVAPWPQALLTGSAVCFYALLVGGDLPVVRAALMASALLVGRALELDGDAANLLGFAALLMMLHQPGCVRDVGFQLSFGATLGILMLAGPLARGVPRLPLRVDVAVAASIAAQAALGPILAAAFHRLAPAAVVLNLAAVPLSSAALLSGLAVVLAWPLGEGLARAVGLVAWLAGRALRASGDLGPLAPWLDVRVPTPSLGLLALHACGLVLLARGRRRSGLLLLAAATAGVVLGPFRPAADGRLHLTAIDVGEGDSLLLRSGSGRALLIDAGGGRDARFDPGERRVAPELWRDGLRRLDSLLITHAHPDHAGGAAFVCRAFHIGEIWEGPAAPADPVWRRAMAALPAGVARRTLVAGMLLDWQGAHIAVVSPPPPGRVPLRVRNEDSLVLDVGFGEVHLLLSGDVEGSAEREMRAGPAFVVKVPHHGGAGSSSEAFVKTVRPRLALVSAGAHNPFGHPRPEVVARYARAGALLLRTDRDGTIEVATDGQRVWVRTSGEAVERRIR